MIRRARPWSLLTALLSVALVFTACQAAPSGTTAPQSPAANIDKNGSYTSNLTSEPDTIDPQKESFVQEIAVTMMVFEALMTPDIKTGKPIPAAAKDQPKVSADGLDYTYTLKDGLKWSDGQPVTPEDFKYGWERLCDPATAGLYAFTGYIVAGCRKWSIMNPTKASKADLDAARTAFLDNIKTTANTITFHLVHPAPYFNSIAATWVGVPVRKDMVEKGGDKWTEPATFIGNGLFKMTEWKHNEKIVLERNDNFRDPPRIKTWTWLMIGDSAVAFAAYRNDQLDTYGVAPTDLRAIDADPTLKAQVQDGPGSCTFYVGFNNKKAPFTDRNVRLAFSKSFDRAAFVNDVQHGLGKPATSFIPPGIPGYDPGDTFQKFDVTAAKDHLAKASPEVKPAIDAIKVTYASYPTNKTVMEWLQGQWKANLGVSVALDPVDPKTFSQLTKKAETLPQVFYLAWCSDYNDQQDWLSTVFRSDSTSTPIGYDDPAYDKLVDAGDREPDAATRNADYQQASRLLSQDAPVAFLVYTVTKDLNKPWVHDHYITPSGYEEAVYHDLYVTKH